MKSTYNSLKNLNTQIFQKSINKKIFSIKLKFIHQQVPLLVPCVNFTQITYFYLFPIVILIRFKNIRI